jgi:mRNA-degrading endonuclease HigB of HigAB toxin-antitoxin module
MAAGNVAAASARAWLAEAVEARWTKPRDVLKQYRDAETIDASTMLVPLDDAGCCVVFVVEYRCHLVVVVFAGQKGEYAMRKRSTGRKS